MQEAPHPHSDNPKLLTVENSWPSLGAISRLYTCTWQALNQIEKLLFYILSTLSRGSMSWSGSYCQGRQDWEMCYTFQRSKAVSLWCQTTHLIWCQTDLSSQTDKPGSHNHYFWNQAKDLPSCRCASFKFRPLCFVDTRKLLTVWF